MGVAQKTQTLQLKLPYVGQGPISKHGATCRPAVRLILEALVAVERRATGPSR